MIIRLYNAYKKKGLLEFTKLAISRFIHNLIAFPIALTIVAIFPWFRLRFIKLYSWRVGHYGVNTHFMLCALETNYFNCTNKYKTIFYADPRYSISNEYLHQKWKEVITVFPWPTLCFQIDRFLSLFLGKKYQEDSLKKTFEHSIGYYDKWGFYDKIKKSYLSFTPGEHHKGRELMIKLGIAPHSEFVCLLVRDSKYLQVHMPDSDWQYHNYRDSDINNYKKAIEFLVEKGYYVVRMGKYVHTKLDINHPKVIDYANHELRSDFMDIYLSAHCTFFMSTGTGIESIAQIFRRPLLITNYALCDLKSYLNYEILIPKKVMDLNHSRFLTFRELYAEFMSFKNIPTFKGLDRKSMFEAWQKKGWRIIENTPEEIVEAVEEMLKRLKKTWCSSDESRLLQERFWQSFPEELADGITSYQDIRMQIGDAFLRRYQSLLN